MPPFVTLDEAKTHLSALVNRAATGEEPAIARNGVARARQPPNAIRILRIATEFDAPVIDALFSGKLA